MLRKYRVAAYKDFMQTLGILSPSKDGRKYLDTSVRAGAAQDFQRQLLRQIVGQEEAVTALTDLYGTFVAGLSLPGRPLGNLLFLGPTGTGKTRVVEAAAEAIYGNAKAVTKIDCGEMQHSHEIAKLIGSPPGYLGHRETKALLSQEVLNQFHTDKVKISFVLFDEIEKASDALWNLLLGILDKAVLTLGDNRQVDFQRSFVIMTSNLGAAELAKQNRPFGLTPPQALSATEKHKKNERIGARAARGRFSPEFINRLDKVVMFKSLDQAAIATILDLELDAVQRQLYSQNVIVQIRHTDAAKELLIQEGFDVTYGARHLKRAIQRLLVHPLSNLLGSKQLVTGESVEVDAAIGGTELLFCKQ